MSLLAGAAIAAAPILVILVLMLVLRWSAARAGLVGLAATLLLAWFLFGYGAVTYAELGELAAAYGAMLEAGFTALSILWIIFPALCIYHLQSITGSLVVLQRALQRVSGDPRIIALIVGWFFALFMEGAAGFGTPVALAAPILVSAGFRPVDAVVLAMVGHAVGVSFGAVGTPVMPQIAVTDFSGLEISAATGVNHALLGWIMTFMVMVTAQRALKDSSVPGMGVWLWTASAAAFFLLPFFAISKWIGPELPTLGGSLAGGMLFMLLLYGYQRRGEKGLLNEKTVADRAYTVFMAGVPYVLLVALVLLTRLVPPLSDFLRDAELGWSLFGEFSGRIEVLYHPGTMLFVAFVAGGLVQKAQVNDLAEAAWHAARQIAPVTVALIAMLGISRLMVHSGMIDTLAEAAAVSAGGFWPFLAPLVGVLGTFITGSATASNILFTDFQSTTAQSLELPELRMLGAQGFGAAVGNIICPHNIIAGGATVGLSGQEGTILRRTIVPCLIYAVAGGLLVWLLV